ncbi:MAG: ImmA/IrrE family metallo-endopeptidase, partial [Planctomycetaceae bacterium]
DQRASRAFAAELLVPQSALIEDLDTDDASLEEIERLAAKYQVSTRVIENQLQNQGITVLPE